MRVKILTLGLICLFIFLSCDKGIKNPYSPEPFTPPEPEPVLVGIKEIKITLFIDFTDDNLIPFLNPIYFYHEINVRIHRDNWPEAMMGEYMTGVGIITKELSKFFGTSPGWQAEANKYHTIDSRYSVARIPSEEQKKIRWRFQVAIELNDPQYKVKIWAGDKEGFDTGWFDGWEETSEEYWPALRNLFTFLIQLNN